MLPDVSDERHGSEIGSEKRSAKARKMPERDRVEAKLGFGKEFFHIGCGFDRGEAERDRDFLHWKMN
ncbi:hypothetical protein TIFTF001_008510 [Ficus carica]|uniref:Uncharacterized protein n=1 Tax=Ficus carica TaxID=3494 RepID=A0AA88D1S9_FICCA|nr:hypothetical protein TIFTF001_008510 [Ficus carica]